MDQSSGRLASEADSVPGLRELLALTELGPDRHEARMGEYPWGRVYGGLVVAQALVAASSSVAEPLHVVHRARATFLEAPTSEAPVALQVRRDRDGRSFSHRTVDATQGDRFVLRLDASFHAGEPGPDRSVWLPPDVPHWSELAEDHHGWNPHLRRRWLHRDTERGEVRAWMRLAGEATDDRSLSAAALAYASDDLAPVAAFAAYPDQRVRAIERNFFTASLDHAIWFHHPVSPFDWHVHDYRAIRLAGGRGLAMGRILDEEGTHAATITQEVLMRQVDHSDAADDVASPTGIDLPRLRD